MKSKKTKEINFKLLYSRILVKPPEKKNKTEGGIILQEDPNERPDSGIVVAVGSGKQKTGKIKPMTIKVGDTVLFSNFVGHDLVIEGEKYLIMNEDDVVGTLIKDEQK